MDAKIEKIIADTADVVRLALDGCYEDYGIGENDRLDAYWSRIVANALNQVIKDY